MIQDLREQYGGLYPYALPQNAMLPQEGELLLQTRSILLLPYHFLRKNKRLGVPDKQAPFDDGKDAQGAPYR